MPVLTAAYIQGDLTLGEPAADAGRLKSLNDAGAGQVVASVKLDMGDGRYLQTQETPGPDPAHPTSKTEMILDRKGNVLRKIEWLAVEQQSEPYHFLVTVSEYDSSGRPVRESHPFTVTDPAQRYTAAPAAWKTTSFYDARGNVLQTTDARGNTTYYTYDKLGNVLASVDPLNIITESTYDSRGNLTSITVGNAASTTAEAKTTTRFEYAASRPGLVSAVKDGVGNVLSTFQYNAEWQVVATTSATGMTTYFGYDANGNRRYTWRIETIDGVKQRIVNRTDFDAAERVVGTALLNLVIAAGEADDVLPAGIESAAAVWTTSTHYNAAGQVDWELDRFGNRTDTRKKEKPNGAWSADARWGDKNNPRPWYRFAVPHYQPCG